MDVAAQLRGGNGEEMKMWRPEGEEALVLEER
jgi:hypothetical protein